MMVKDRSSNAFDTIRIRGKWWIPDGTENPRKAPGELTFEVSAGGILELDEALSDDIREIPVIHGLGTKGECVTLFNGFTVQLPAHFNSVGSFRRETIDFFDMWVGNHWFANKQEVCLEEYSFGIHNIENWADRRCFSRPEMSSSKSASISYSAPEAIPLFEDDRLCIVLDSFHSGPNMSVGQLESSIQHYPRIVIRSKDGLLPYYGKGGSLSEREWMIFVLIALLMGTVTWKFGFEGVVEPIHETDAGFTQEVSARHYFQLDWGKVDPAKRPDHFDLLFPYEALGEQFPRLAKAFSEVFYANENPIVLVYLIQCKDSSFYPSTLPELLFAFEELEKNLFPALNAPIESESKEPIEALRRKLEPYCSKTEKGLLAQKLSSQGLSFTQRFRIAFQEMKDIYQELGTDLAKPLITYFRKTRNDYAHSVKSTSDDHTLYIYATHWLAEFMTLMVFRSCGLSSETIRTVFFRNPGPDRGKTQRFFDYFRMEVATGNSLD